MIGQTLRRRCKLLSYTCVSPDADHFRSSASAASKKIPGLKPDDSIHVDLASDVVKALFSDELESEYDVTYWNFLLAEV